MNNQKFKKELTLLTKMYESAKFDIEILELICCFLVGDYLQLYYKYDSLREEFKSIKKTNRLISVPLDHFLSKTNGSYESLLYQILMDYKDKAYRDYFSSRITSNNKKNN